ncbi:hypothetical protein ACVWXM_008337 [Bradyrhizobium sp. GM7.3]
MQPLRMSRRVMNLAHMLTQNARRHGARPGFVWGDRSWTWREIDAQVSALAAALAGAGHREGRPHPRPFQERRRDVLFDVRRVSAWRGLGTHQFPPDAGRGRLSRAGLRREGVSVPCRFSRARRGRKRWRAGIHLEHRRSGAVCRDVGCGCRRVARRHGGRERRSRARRSLLVLLYIGHHRPLQGCGAHPRSDGFCRHQPSRRSYARRHRSRCLAGGGAAVAWRRRASAGADRARRVHRAAADGEIRH